MDAARAAVRQAGVETVTVYYRRTRQEMPAYPYEIATALEEGVVIEELVAPVVVYSKDGHLTGMRFIRNKLGDRDASGRQKPVAIQGSDFDVNLDTLIVAISEDPDKDGFDGLGLTSWGTISINPESLTTSQPGVFAGGDAVSGPNTVITAIAAGKQAAAMIDRYVTGKVLKVIPKVKLPSVYVEPIPSEEEESGEGVRIESPMISPAQRRGCFAEVELCPSEQAALAEARRCLRCDLDFTQPLPSSGS